MQVPEDTFDEENAAYVWVKSCQSDLRELLGGENAGYPSGWDKISRLYRQLERAVEMHRSKEAQRKARVEGLRAAQAEG